MPHAIGIWTRAILTSLLGAIALTGCTTTQSSPKPVPTSILHTPWIALRIEQNGREVPLLRRDNRTTIAKLKSAPFTIQMPVRSENDLYRIAAYNEEEFLSLADYRNDTLPPYFQEATGIADSAAGSGKLFLNERGHHYLTDLRLGPDPDRHVFHVSEVMFPFKTVFEPRVTVPMSDLSGRLYLVAWYDEDGDRRLGNSEYDYIVLNIKNPQYSRSIDRP